MSHEVQLSSRAIRDIEQVLPRYATAIVEFLFGPLADNPPRVGTPLRHDLDGLHGARRGDYRVVYEILTDKSVVLVHRIDHRARVYTGHTERAFDPRAVCCARVASWGESREEERRAPGRRHGRERTPPSLLEPLRIKVGRIVLRSGLVLGHRARLPSSDDDTRGGGQSGNAVIVSCSTQTRNPTAGCYRLC